MTIFIWIPKTAGTSVAASYGLKTHLSNYKEFDNKGDVTFGHYDVKELLKAGVISKEFWQQAYKFTVVRNPYTRFISLFNDFKRSGRIEAKITPLRFAHTLLHVTRKPGLYNTFDFSQCASQVDWIVPGVEILKLEDMKLTKHLNRSNSDKKYYNAELRKIVTDLYMDDFILLNYDIQSS